MRAFTRYRVNFFRRLILSYTVLTVVLLGLAGGFLYVQANRMMVGEIARDSHNRLMSVKDFVEGTVLRKYENSIRHTALSTVSNAYNADLNFLLDHGWQGNISKISSLRTSLELFKVGNEGVYNATIAFAKGNYAVDSDMFYSDPAHAEDAEFMAYLARLEQRRWIARTLPDGERVLSYAVALPYGTMNEFAKGYLYVDVEIAYVEQIASSMMATPRERLYVYNANGSLALQTAEADPREARELNRLMASGKPAERIQGADGAPFILSYWKDGQSVQGWTYALIRPIDAFVLDSSQFKTNIVLGCLLVLLLGLLVSFFISKRFYIPVKQLMANLRGSHQTGHHQGAVNEFAFIGNVVDSLGRKISTLEMQARAHELKNTLLGADVALDRLDGLPTVGHYVVVHIRPLSGAIHRFSAYMEPFHVRGREWIALGQQEGAIVLHDDLASELETERIQAFLLQMQDSAREELRFGASIGTRVDSPLELSLSYQFAQQAARHQFLYGEEAVLRYDELAVLASTPHLFAYDSFKNAVRAGNVDAMNRFLDDFAHVTRSRKQQLAAVELSLLQLTSTLYQVVIELNVQQIVPPSSLFDELKRPSFDATMAAIRLLSNQVALHVKETSNHAHTELILKLKTYIDERLHEDLTLQILSEVAQLAPAYVSTLFGEVMNETFTEYVTRSRLAKAARLLEEEPRTAVADIAARVGYRNAQPSA